MKKNDASHTEKDRTDPSQTGNGPSEGGAHEQEEGNGQQRYRLSDFNPLEFNPLAELRKVPTNLTELNPLELQKRTVFKPLLNLFGFKTIKAKLLASFTVLFAITLVVIGANFYYDYQLGRTSAFVRAMNGLNGQAQALRGVEAKVFSTDTRYEEFYNEGGPAPYYYQERDQLMGRVLQEIDSVRSLGEAKSFKVTGQLDSLLADFRAYDAVFDRLIEKIKRKGYGKHGLEGDLSRYLAVFDSSQYVFDKSLVTQIRAEQRAFALTDDAEHIDQITQLLEKLRGYVRRRAMPAAESAMLAETLDAYQQAIFAYVEVRYEIGLTGEGGEGGLRGELSEQSDRISAQIAQVNALVEKTGERLQNQTMYLLVGLTVFSVLLFLAIAYFIVSDMSQPISLLSKDINNAIQTRFAPDAQVAVIQSKDELGDLSRDFNLMLSTVRAQIGEIQEKSDRIQERERLLMDSIRYATQIQSAMLPTEEEISASFAEHFVVYRPQHYVSGDFYWHSKQEGRSFIAAIDCTGHGVPGAFMSMIGNSSLNESVNQLGESDPVSILEELHSDVSAALHQSDGKNDDGMDACFCLVEPAERENGLRVTFVGAKRPLFYFKKGEFHELKGTNRSIAGGMTNRKRRPFVKEVIDLDVGDTIYLTSDGYTDQQDADRKKFGKRRFNELLAEVHALPMEEQKARFDLELNRHMKGGVKQRDDITVVGIRL